MRAAARAFGSSELVGELVPQPSILLPSQIGATCPRFVAELGLVAAILEEALRTVSRQAGSVGQWRAREQTHQWFFDDDRQWPFAFRNVCDLVTRLQHTFFLSIVAIGALTPWMSTARAESGNRPPIVVPVLIGDGPGLLIPALLQVTELTDEQGTVVRQVLEKEGPPMRDLFNALRQANLALATKTLGATNPRPAEIAPLLRQISDLRRRLAEHEMTMFFRIRAVLKPEQLAHLENVTQSVMQNLRGLAAPPEGATPTE
jgi:hypothetical protein